MNDTHSLFFSLLRYAIGTGDGVAPMTFADVREVYDMARRQSMAAVLYGALEKGGFRPADADGHQDEFEDLLMEWMGEKVKTVRMNGKIDKDVAGVTEWLDGNGFETCLLKGQGNALLYPDPTLRTAGDIDLWVRTKEHHGLEHDTREVIRFVREHGRHEGNAIYHHADGLEWNGAEVELHYRPHFMQNLIHNARLQRFFFSNADNQFRHFAKIGGRPVAVPTLEFDIVFQLSHIYQHLFNEGIGLRQVLDYFYVLKAYHESEAKAATDWKRLLAHLGLGGIAGAVTWILTEAFGMSRDWAVVAPDGRRGRFVLDEILRGGNFGKYDERNRRFGRSWTGRNVQRMVRDLRLVRYFPSEALGEPLFRLWHAWWRVRHN